MRYKTAWGVLPLAALSSAVSLALVDSAVAQECIGAEAEKLVASDGVSGDDFGNAAISGTIVIVGAQRDQDLGENAGSAYIFERQADETWIQTSKLLASDGEVDDFFGGTVAIYQTTAIIGAEDYDSDQEDTGAVYVFERQIDGSWLEVAILTAADAKAISRFGASLVLDDGLAIVGAPWQNHGTVYVFEQQPNDTWLLVTQLTASDQPKGGARFGNGLSLDGDTLVVGASQDADNGVNSGAIYVFERIANDNWVEVDKLIASDGESWEWFGSDVLINGDLIVVGSSEHGHNYNSAGAVYVFEPQEDGSWVEVAELLASDGGFGDHFGRSVAMIGNVAVIGALPNKDKPDEAGLAYLFERDNDGEWVELGKIQASDRVIYDQFAANVNVAKASNQAFASATWNDGVTTGAVYVVGGLSDCNENGVLDVCEVANGDSDDLNNNGVPDECDCYTPGAILYFNPSAPYASSEESPFSTGSPSFQLEDFEDGVLDLVGVTASAGVVRSPSDFTDSVDADDGVIDGTGTDGHSFWQLDGTTGITFTFDAKLLGGLPTQVGLVWTDGNPDAVFTIAASNSDGDCVVRNHVMLGDGTGDGLTEEDRFLGVEFHGGIAEMSIWTSFGGFEIDHLQLVLSCPWDLDNNGNVGAADLLALLAAWSTDPGGPPDFDGDGNVGASDLLALLANWGPCP